MPRLSIRELGVHAVLVLLLLAFAFPAVFLKGEMITSASILLDSPPWSHHRPDGYEPIVNWLATDSIIVNSWMLLAQRAIDNGEWPLWNHLQLGGMPLLANYQSRAFHPLRLLFALGDYFVMLTLYHLIVAWLCGMNTYLCGRVHGLSVAASRFFSVAWMFGFYAFIWAYWCEPDEAVWLPIVFIGVEFLMRGLYRRGFCAMALGAVMLLLVGHPESAFSMGVGTGLYFVGRLLTGRKPLRAAAKASVFAAGAWLVAVAVCSAQILPFLEYLPESFDATNRVEQGVEAKSIPLGSLAVLWAPRFFGVTALDNYWGWENSNFIMLVYGGIATWLGAFLLLARKGARLFKGRIFPLLIPTALCFLMAFDVPVVRSVKQLPFLKLSWQLWHAGFALFGLAFLASMGYDQWFSTRRRLREVWVVLPLVAVAALVLGGTYLVNLPTLTSEGVDAYVLAQMGVACLLALFALIVVLAGGRWPAPKLWLSALTALLAADLLFGARDLHPTAPRDELFVETELIQRLRGLEQPSRVSVLTAQLPIPAHTGIMPPFGVESLWGYDGIFPKRFLRFMGECNARAWDKMEPVFAVDHYLFPPDAFEREGPPPHYELVDTIDGLSLYRNTRAFHRAYLVGEVRALANEDALFAAIEEPRFDPARTCLTEAPPDAALPNDPSGLAGTARVVERTSTRVVVDVHAERACALVLADTFYPGWTARVDGEATELFPANYAFRGVLVPPGEHEVVFEFRPKSFRTGLGVSTAALVLSAAAAVVTLLWSRRVSAP